MRDDNQRDDEIISRRQDELEALQAFYGHQLRSSLPSAQSSRSGDTSNANANDDDDDDEVISLNGPWFIELIDISNSSNHANNFKIPTLEIRLPPHYPLSPPPSSSSQNSSFPPTLILHHVDNHHDFLLPSLQKQALIEELMEMYEPEMDMAIMWAERCREEFLDVDLTAIMSSSEAAAADDTNGNDDDDDDVITTARKIDTSEDYDDKRQQSLSIRFLTFNHLLYGKSHKKESQIVSLAGKLGLIGFIVYGTPGIIGLLMYNNNGGNDEDILLDFAKECSSNRIGKRATVLDLEMKFASNGELLSSPEYSDNDVVEAAEWGGKTNNSNNGGKKIASKKKSKSKGGSGNNNSDSDNKSSTGESSRPLLANLLGADRVTLTNDSVSIVDENKSGLRHFDSIAELKEVLPNNSGIIQSILGL